MIKTSPLATKLRRHLLIVRLLSLTVVRRATPRRQSPHRHQDG